MMWAWFPNKLLHERKNSGRWLVLITPQFKRCSSPKERSCAHLVNQVHVRLRVAGRHWTRDIGREQDGPKHYQWLMRWASSSCLIHNDPEVQMGSLCWGSGLALTTESCLCPGTTATLQPCPLVFPHLRSLSLSGILHELPHLGGLLVSGDISRFPGPPPAFGPPAPRFRQPSATR